MMNQPDHLEETIEVFKLLDAQPRVEPRGVSPVAILGDEPLPPEVQNLIDHEEASQESVEDFDTGEAIYRHESGSGYLAGVYEPGTVEREGLVVDGFLAYDDRRLQGELVEDVYLEIIEATQAPYLDQGLSDQDLEGYVAGDLLGNFDVPVDYDQDALEQSVEAAVARLDAVAAVQDAVAETAAEYADELREEGIDYQQ